MKRVMFSLLLIVGLLCLPLSHLVLAKGQVERRGKERVEICHIDDEASAIVGAPAGHFISVAAPAVPAHERHGDCLATAATVDEATGFCVCGE